MSEGGLGTQDRGRAQAPRAAFASTSTSLPSQQESRGKGWSRAEGPPAEEGLLRERLRDAWPRAEGLADGRCPPRALLLPCPRPSHSWPAGRRSQRQSSAWKNRREKSTKILPLCCRQEGASAALCHWASWRWRGCTSPAEPVGHKRARGLTIPVQILLFRPRSGSLGKGPRRCEATRRLPRGPGGCTKHQRVEGSECHTVFKQGKHAGNQRLVVLTVCPGKAME